MAELNKQEIQSPELQEVMSEIPGSFLKWGLFIFFAIILILVIGSYFIKSPEIVTVPVVITTQNPPVMLVAKTGGEIEKLFVLEGSEISKDEVVAIISNTSDYEDVKKLNLFLSGCDDKSDWVEVVKTQQPPPDLSLGEIQSNYSGFQKEWKQMKDYLEQAYIPAKLSLLEKQIEKKTEYNSELAQQKKYLTEDLALAKSSFDRDSLLFRKDSYSISAKEYDKSRQGYIQKLYSFSVFNASLKNNEADFLRLKETRLDLQVQYEKEMKQYIFTMEETFQLLRSSISQWEERYVIMSSIAGKITFIRFRSENQVIKAGESLATVIPNGPTNIVARAIIPISGFGKIEIGQTVNIKLSGFPYMQYGVLKGRIFSVSQVPGEGGFSADIELTGGMTSTYREKIRFIHQMDGTADIITKDTRLINKFISPVRSALKN
ncbi:MAG TPA: HlyD family efflux transporter periplasmic adaptor subunit [Bacteroidales bacterium]|nr:HlyD family efflux transporter periplasmic adaptor subunit [Bacteroidales bacterium]